MPTKYEKLIEAGWKATPILNANLKHYTTFKLDTHCKLLLPLSNISELKQFLTLSKTQKINWLILGRGSNSVFTDEGFNGVVLVFKGAFKTLKFITPNKIYAGSSALNNSLARCAFKNSLSGAEFLTTIPGTIGGGIYMNAGAHSCEFKDIIKSVATLNLTGKKMNLSPQECKFAYRSSLFQTNKLIITGALFQLTPTAKDMIQQNQTELLNYRKLNQPIHAATFGSIFTNPPGISAAKLIEGCGLKGAGYGDASISTKHANFIENKGKATFAHIKQTIILIKNNVKQKYNIDLNLELVIFDKNGKKISI